jgi:hypothetical protein
LISLINDLESTLNEEIIITLFDILISTIPTFIDRESRRLSLKVFHELVIKTQIEKDNVKDYPLLKLLVKYLQKQVKNRYDHL